MSSIRPAERLTGRLGEGSGSIPFRPVILQRRGMLSRRRVFVGSTLGAPAVAGALEAVIGNRSLIVILSKLANDATI